MKHEGLEYDVSDITPLPSGLGVAGITMKPFPGYPSPLERDFFFGTGINYY